MIATKKEYVESRPPIKAIVCGSFIALLKSIEINPVSVAVRLK